MAGYGILQKATLMFCMSVVQSVAANGLSDRVSIVHRDIGLLQRGREIRALGANVALADIFDAGDHTLIFVCSSAHHIYSLITHTHCK